MADGGELDRAVALRGDAALGGDEATARVMPQDDVNDAGDRIRSILRRRAIAQHLDTRDRRHRDEVQVDGRSEEHTSELQSLMRISYAVFCLKKNKTKQ